MELDEEDHRRLRVILRTSHFSTGDECVVVRFGEWKSENIRNQFREDSVAAYDEFLQRHPEVRRLVEEKFGDTYFPVSVFLRPGDLNTPPDDEVLVSWLSKPMANRYGQYREALIESLESSGFLVLPTDIEDKRDPDPANHSMVSEGHFDVICKNDSDEELDNLQAVFQTVCTNAYKDKTRTRVTRKSV